MTMNAAEDMDNFYSRCLLCTRSPAVMQHFNISSETGNELQLAEKINKYLNIQIVAELPQRVCYSCMGKLEVTHELWTSSQQATVTLLHIKQQIFDQEVNREISDCSMQELDQQATDGAAIYNENSMDTKTINELPMHTAEDFEQSTNGGLAVHFVMEDTEKKTVPFEEIDIEEHSIKIEPGDEDCLPQNVVEPPLESKLTECRVMIPKLLECESCSFYSDNKAELAVHMQAHQTPATSDTTLHEDNPANDGRREGLVSCVECSSIFAFPEMLVWHTENCHGPEPTVKVIQTGDNRHQFQCTLCECAFHSHSEIIQHVRIYHNTGNLPFHCNICNTQYSSKYDLKHHQVKCKKKNGTQVKYKTKNSQVSKVCNICNQVFKSEYKLKKHVSVFHNNEKFHFKCLNCNESFSNTDLLNMHCRIKHPGMQNWQCNLCHSGFITYQGFLDHKKYKHGGKKLACFICAAVFSYPHTLRDHLELVHSGLQNTLACNICNRKFKCDKYLQDHMRRVHTASILYCEHCIYSTRRKYCLASHIRLKHDT